MKISLQWARTLLGASVAANVVLALVLAVAFDLATPAATAAGCVALAAFAGLLYAAWRTGRGSRLSDTGFSSVQLAALFLLLAWLTRLAKDAPPEILVLYLLAMALTFAWFTYVAGIIHRLRTRLAEAHRRLHEVAAEADDRASRDTLTGVYHHRHLMEAMEREIARAERIGKPVSIARVDLDWLGSVNQTHGHAAGDIALKRFTLAAAGALRDVDVFGRYGGKEFLAIMPDTGLEGAMIAAERIRAAVAREPVPEVQGRRRLSCTLGIAEYQKGENMRLVISRAEASLILAKAAGRNRVEAG